MKSATQNPEVTVKVKTLRNRGFDVTAYVGRQKIHQQIVRSKAELGLTIAEYLRWENKLSADFTGQIR